MRSATSSCGPRRNATTAESIYDEELEQVFADVAESERTPAPGTVEETMSRLHRAIWLADRPNQQEQHLLARCGCASSCSSQAGQQEAAVLRTNEEGGSRAEPHVEHRRSDTVLTLKEGSVLHSCRCARSERFKL